MRHNPYYGPTFGGRHVLHISNDANNNSRSCYNPGDSYEIPPRQTDTFLVGFINFKLLVIEVFQMIWQFICWCNLIAVKNKLFKNSYLY